mmetsp:Transcript_43872/g.125501  ORF Transcript_43872/g.125501 Transcript_43872/m.125501 type:complete len:289 (-) Transcript_43872:466-1332(-)
MSPSCARGAVPRVMPPRRHRRCWLLAWPISAWPGTRIAWPPRARPPNSLSRPVARLWARHGPSRRSPRCGSRWARARTSRGAPRRRRRSCCARSARASSPMRCGRRSRSAGRTSARCRSGPFMSTPLRLGQRPWRPPGIARNSPGALGTCVRRPLRSVRPRRSMLPPVGSRWRCARPALPRSSTASTEVLRMWCGRSCWVFRLRRGWAGTRRRGAWPRRPRSWPRRPGTLPRRPRPEQLSKASGRATVATEVHGISSSHRRPTTVSSRSRRAMGGRLRRRRRPNQCTS